MGKKKKKVDKIRPGAKGRRLPRSGFGLHRTPRKPRRKDWKKELDLGY